MAPHADTLTDSALVAEKSAPRILFNFIDGRWVAAQTSTHLDVTNPANGEVLARVPLSTAVDVEA
ncbi:MAG: hypothetical protein WCB53_01855, partial [Terriglobales bacterium]